MDEWCKKQGCPNAKDMSDVEGFVMMFFRKSGKCRIHTAGRLDIENVYLASKQALREMIKDIQGEKIDYAA